jgi:hypothetical protein
LLAGKAERDGLFRQRANQMIEFIVFLVHFNQLQNAV